MRIYTRKGDDGTTGLLYGGRVGKASARIEVNGAVDEAQAALGMARSEADPGSELDEILISLERELYVLMAEVATAPANRRKLVAGVSLVAFDMVEALEHRIDELSERFTMPEEFVLPGGNRRSAALDVARTAVRRAERVLVQHHLDEPGDGTSGKGRSEVGPYLNRLSDLLWTMARWQDGTGQTKARPPGRNPGTAKRGGP